MSTDPGRDGGPVSPAAWSFLVVSAAVLLVVVLLSTNNPDWLVRTALNPAQLRQLPAAFQVRELWRDALPPLLLAGLVAIASRWWPRRPWIYGLAEVLLVVMALRYLIWRSTTLNTAHPFSLGCSVLQFSMEVCGILVLCLQLMPGFRFDLRQRSREADQGESWVAAHQPSVDVWIPTYNESTRLVRRAILTCRQLRHSRLRITVLDDGHRPAIASLARDLGVEYLSREGNAHRKAGNLNHALAYSRAEFIAVFDCDFCPAPQFLRRTLGFFADPRVAIVQTPQYYFQPDFHHQNLGLDVLMPGDLEYFYQFLQVLRDRSNAVVCCGTSYVVRRQALESIGGYMTRCLVEDYQTGTRLLTQGWTVRYLNEVLSMGEVPRRFADFLDQRLRWMQGNIQVYFCGRELPIWRRLNLQQLRWYVLPADLLAPIWRVVYLVMPLLGLVLGFSVIAAPTAEFIAYGLPFLLLLYAIPNWMSNHYHHQFWMEVYETIFCFPALQRAALVLRHPFRLYGGIVTNKDSSAEQQRFNLRLSWPLLMLLLTIVLTVSIRYVGPALGLWGSQQEGYDGEAIMLSWNLYNALVLAVSVLACVDRPLPAGADRFPIRRIACLELNGCRHWGTTSTLSEEEIGFVLQNPQVPALAGEGQLRLVDPEVSLAVRVTAQQGAQLQLRLGANPAAAEATLLGLIYSAEHWFHAPRRLGTSDALLHWLGSLWRPQPILGGGPRPAP